MGVKNTAKNTVTVTVVEPFQVVLDGTVYAPGDAVEVPQALADEWRQAGWVT